MAWVVFHGSLVDTTQGGGLEFVGPFESEEAALDYRKRILAAHNGPEFSGFLCQAVEMLSPR